MPDNFKQVVNLQAKTSEETVRPKPKVKQKTLVNKARTEQCPVRTKKKPSLVEGIDQVYSDEDLTEGIKEELSQIDRPKLRNRQDNFFKQVSIVFFLIILAMLSFYFLVDKTPARHDDKEIANLENLKGEWYFVQLANKEVYYGFIRDVTDDPVVLEKVYYNYNQISGEDTDMGEEKVAANIRLVKRGKESHGPDGTMNIVRAQLMYMEVLGEESKILQAILDYEE